MHPYLTRGTASSDREVAHERALQMAEWVQGGGKIEIKRAGGIKNAKDVWDALTYGGATLADVYTAYIKKNSSTPNFTHHILSELVLAMKADGMYDMGDFKTLRGRQVAFPKK